MGLVTVTPTTNLNGTLTSPGNISDAVIDVGTGVNLALAGGTVTGAIDFADAANTSTGGSCPSDPGGTCKVNTSSVFTGGMVTGVTLTYSNAVTNAINEWNGLIAGAAWSSNAGSTAANLKGGAAISLCTGTFTGCTFNNNTTTTRAVNGVKQTAYVFDITGTTGGVINQNITIKADSNSMVVLYYNGASTLSVAKAFTVTGGATSDQVLLSVVTAAGITTASGFNFTGSIAVKSTTQILTGSAISGRL